MDSILLYWVCVVAGFIADAIAKCIMPKRRPPSDFMASRVDHMSDDEIDGRLRANTGQTLSDEAGVELHDNNIRPVTNTTVLKSLVVKGELMTSEALILDILFHHTTIPVPRVHRRLLQDPCPGFIMDRIRGRQLAQVWPSLSILGKIRIAFLLRHYVQQLRVIKHPRSSIPGPLAAGTEALCCQCPLFGEIGPPRGPFASYSEFSAFWNAKYESACRDAARRGHTESTIPPGAFDDSRPLVLTHCDLNMRNMLVGDDGRLWLIDWTWSGFYPEWFEYTAARLAWELSTPSRLGRDSEWMFLLSFVCGPYLRQWKWYSFMAYMFDFSN